MTEQPRCVVLVEGASDAVVLEVLGRRLGLDSPSVRPGVRVVSMGGVTNIGPLPRRVRRAAAGGPVRRRRDEVLRARPAAPRTRRRDRGRTRRAGVLRVRRRPRGRADPGTRYRRPDRGRSAARASSALLRTLQQQPAQRERSLHDQLHRFFGTKSGRKVRLARARRELGLAGCRAARACSPSPRRRAAGRGGPARRAGPRLRHWPSRAGAGSLSRRDSPDSRSPSRSTSARTQAGSVREYSRSAQPIALRSQNDGRRGWPR